MSFEAAVHAKAIQLDHLSLDMCAAAGSGHPSSAMSLGHIVTVLMYHSMRWLPDHPHYATSDRLVLSEGHAVPIVYAALADLGGAVGKDNQLRPLNVDDLMTLRNVDSILEGHPSPMAGVPFFDAATGSLGQGLSVSAGLATAARRDDIDKRVFCIIGDGESREGQVWEAIDFLVDHRLGNVLAIFNCNGYGQADPVSPQQEPARLAARLEACGIDVSTIDGHSPDAIREAFERFIEASGGDKPMAVVAQTVKGWGAPSLQGAGWHGKPVTGEALDQVHSELKSTGVGLTSALASDELRIYPPTEHVPREVQITEPVTFNEALKTYDMEGVLQGGKFQIRTPSEGLDQTWEVNDRYRKFTRWDKDGVRLEELPVGKQPFDDNPEFKFKSEDTWFISMVKDIGQEVTVEAGTFYECIIVKVGVRGENEASFQEYTLAPGIGIIRISNPRTEYIFELVSTSYQPT